jgi:hypothetical protein
MATPQLSPGVLVREVDLTVGRADNVLDNIGAIAGPFPLDQLMNQLILLQSKILSMYLVSHFQLMLSMSIG